MPLIKNQGRYGELGHWGKRSGRRFTKKKILLLGTLLSLSLIFAISHNGNIFPIVNAGDYNTSFSHTRTLIFGDNFFTGPTGHGGGTISFNSKVNATCAVSCGGSPVDTVLTFPALTVTSGDTILVQFWASAAFSSARFAVTDSQGNSYTQKVSLTHSNPGLNVFINGTQTVTTGSDTVTITSSVQNVFAGVASDYSGAIGFGNTATNGGSGGVGPTTGTSTITITPSATSSFIVEFMAVSGTGGSCSVNVGSAQTLRNEDRTSGSGATDITGLSGSQNLSLNWICSTDQDQFTHVGLELTQSPLNFGQVRWNFNSTCVTLKGPSPREADFDWSKGIAGSGGANCNSANIIVSKSQVNFQTAAGRMLEIIWMAATLNSTNTQSIDLVFRTNSTLPIFTENYNPFNDTNAKLIYEACTRFSTTCAGSGQTIYIQHDPNKSINTETRANDFVVSGPVPDFKNNAPVLFQAVLNFTGPLNYINEETSITTSNNSNNTASALQMGQSYNLLIKVNTSGAPTGTPAAEVTNTFGSFNNIPAPLSIWSVPPSCADPVNKVACGLGTPTPVFQFNPLDPSSWGNAIIQGLLWVFTVALPTGLLIIAKVLLQVVQVTFNAVGNQFGWGNIGDNIVTFFNSLPSLFGQIGTALGWLGSIISLIINTIIISNLLANPVFAGLVNLLNDVKTLFTNGLIINFLTQIAFWFPTSYMIILISTYFLFIFLKGLSGFFEWLHLVKWTAFQMIGLFSLFLYMFVKLITAILGRLSIISPGHEFPRLPHPEPGELPRISLHGEIAFFDDPTAWFLTFTGFIFTMMWAGTSAAGLPANTQTIIQSMSTLFLTLFGIGFMVLLLYIPGFLLGKLYEKGIIT